MRDQGSRRSPVIGSLVIGSLVIVLLSVHYFLNAKKYKKEFGSRSQFEVAGD